MKNNPGQENTFCKVSSIKRRILFLLILIFAFSWQGKSQSNKIYPPYTKWYQDPLGLKPLVLSSVPGFVWASVVVTATLLFVKKDPSFQKKISTYYESGFSSGYKPPYTSVLNYNAGCMYDLRKWMSVGLEMNTSRFKDQTNKTWGFGLRPSARWFLYSSKKTSLFIEYGAGVSYSIAKFPLSGTGWDADTARTGTKFNLTSKYGIGIAIHLNDHFSLQAGVRHTHLSNGNVAGIQRNPSHDSNGPFAGLYFHSKKKVNKNLF